VFWTTFGHGRAGEASLMKSEIGRNGAVALATGQQAPHSLALDDTSVFWGSGDWPLGQEIMTIAQDGGRPTWLADAGPYLLQLVVHGSFLYWTEFYAVKRISVTGGEVVTLATDRADARGLAIDDTYVYWTDWGIDTHGAGLFKVPVAGGKPVLLNDALFGPWAIALDASSIYVAALEPNQGQQAIWRVPKSGGAATLLVVDDNLYPRRLVVDGSRLYWSTPLAIKALDLPTNEIASFETPLSTFDLALNETTVFFTFLGAGDDKSRMTDGSIWKACKP
jgi:hypothetical protein